MLRKITVDDLTRELAAHDKTKSVFGKIWGDTKQVKELKAFVAKLTTTRRAFWLESKEDLRALSFYENAELRKIMDRDDLTLPLFKNIADVFFKTADYAFLSEHNYFLLFINDYFPREQLKTAENLLLLEKHLDYTYNLKQIFKFLDELNLLTTERFQQVLKSKVDKDDYMHFMHLLPFLKLIAEQFKDAEPTIFESIDFENVCRYSEVFLSLREEFRMRRREDSEIEYDLHMPQPLFLQILKQAKFIKDLVKARDKFEYGDDALKLFYKLCEAPQYALTLVEVLTKVTRSKIKWDKMGTSEDEVIQLLCDNPELAQEIADAIHLLVEAKASKKLNSRSWYGDDKDAPSLLTPQVFQAIKAQPQYAKQLQEGLVELEKDDLTTSIWEPRLPDMLTEENVDLLRRNPQHAKELAESLRILYRQRNYSSMSFYMLDKYPEHSVLMTRFLLRIRKAPEADTLKNYEILGENIAHLKGIVDLMGQLVSIGCLNPGSLACVFKHAEHAEKIAKIMALDESSYRRTLAWKNNFILLTQNTALLDEIYVDLSQRKEVLKSNFKPGSTIEDMINFKLFTNGIDSSKGSQAHRFFGTHQDAKDQPVNNHRLASPDVVNHIRKFVVG